MTKQLKSRGFTIVELLIVIVVIAILAAITIVAYNGIQNRARTSASASASETTQKKAEAANAVAGSYPTTIAGFTAQSDSDLTGSGISFVGAASGAGNITTAPSSTNTVVYNYCSAPASNSAYQIIYWDYTANATKTVTGGLASTCTTWTDVTTTAKNW